MVTDAVATVQLQQATATSTVTQAGQVDDRHHFQNPDICSGPDRVLGAPPHPALPAPMDLQPEVAEIDFTAFTRLASERTPGRLVVRRIPDLHPQSGDGRARCSTTDGSRVLQPWPPQGPTVPEMLTSAP
ncbi:MAG: hypothetical protein EOP24_49010 [Hyphomicrobiales bacterium]|nr:MAG: hypothetical protein EOP24_49010 [Hyphomicrobiales bacterium]